MKDRLKIAGIVFLFLVSLTGCWLYSFTGASIPLEAKTVSIEYFPNRAPIIQPTLSQTFTESLKDKFVTQTRLQLVSKNGDLQFSGEIKDYSTAPMGILVGETAAMTRLTISIHVKFTNLIDPKQNFDSDFSWYNDYASSYNLNEVENKLIDEIVKKLTEDIFNKAVVNW